MMTEDVQRDGRPLAGKHIVITRSPEQAVELAVALEAYGARVTTLASIAIRPLDDTTELDAALRTLSEYDWIVLTSANGARAVAERMRALQVDWDTRRRARIAVIGPATARALEETGATADLVPEQFIAESILDELANVAGQRILLLRADIARKTLADELRIRGADVDEVTAYRTELASIEAAALDALLVHEHVDAVTFTSPSTVHGLMRGLAAAGLEPAHTLASVALCAIGPITAEALRGYGLEPHVTAKEYTMVGLVAALRDFFMTGAPA
jgi:uroporphyrinogen-III synthase